MAETVRTVTSPQYGFISKDFKSLAIGLGITLAGAALTYLTEYVTKTDFGQWTPIIVTVWALIVNTVKKYISESQYNINY
jgi:hypothetical protein